MSQSKPDGKASIPPFYRKWIAKRYGQVTMINFDSIGHSHDIDIVELGWAKANSAMRFRMKLFKLPFWGIRLPVSIAITFYRWLPRTLKNLYPYT